MATLSTFIGLPVSIPLGAISLAGASVSGVTTVLTKKYQKKLTKVTKLTDIITSAIAVFETCLSKALARLARLMRKSSTCFRHFTLKHLTNCLMPIAKWKQKTETNSKKVCWKR